jgi:hypothetical protein
LGGKTRRTIMKKRNPLILNAEQLSLILNISEQTVKKLAKDREIPCTYVNRRPQFNWDALINYFQGLEGGAA